MTKAAPIHLQWTDDGDGGTCAERCEPNCDRHRDLREGCPVCRLYVCPSCGELTPWDNGGTDGVECDECWVKAERRYAGEMQ